MIYQWDLYFDIPPYTLNIQLIVNICSRLSGWFFHYLLCPPFPPFLMLTLQENNPTLHIKYFNFSRLSFTFYSKGSLPSNDTKALLISKTHLASEQKKGNSECKMVEKDLSVHLVHFLFGTKRPRGICPIDSGAVAAGENRVPLHPSVDKEDVLWTPELSESQVHQTRRSKDSYTPRSMPDGNQNLMHTLRKIS